MKIALHTARDRLLPIFLSQAVGLGCGLAGVRLTSQLIPPETFGRYGVFLTFTTLGMWVVYAGLLKYTVRHWAAADRAGLLRAVTRAGVRKFPWLALACAAAAFALPGAGHGRPDFAALLVVTTLLSLAALAQTALQAAREHWRDFTVAALGSLTRSLVPPAMFVLLGGTTGALYLGFGVHALVFAGAGLWMLRREWNPRNQPVADAELPPVYDGALFTALAIASWALLGLNRWIMALFFGPAETGYFSLAANLATLIPSMLGTIFLQYIQPEFFAAESATPADRAALARWADRVALLHAAVAIAGLLALRLIAPYLIGPLIKAAYTPALPWLVPAGCFMLAITSGIFFHSMLLAGRRERACGPVDLTAAAVLVAGGFSSAALGGEAWFVRWLVVSPLVPWLVNRPLARRYLLREEERRARPGGL